MKSYLVYLAGPISGLTFEESIGWRQQVIENIHPSIQGLSPLRGKEYLKPEKEITGSYTEWPLSTQRGIYSRDKFDCLRADLVLVNLLNATTISMGTIMEIAWAAQNSTPIILMMKDGNIHEHPMVREACDFIVSSLDEGIALVDSILVPNDHT